MLDLFLDLSRKVFPWVRSEQGAALGWLPTGWEVPPRSEDNNCDGEISFDEFCRALVLLPAINPRAVYEKWFADPPRHPRESPVGGTDIVLRSMNSRSLLNSDAVWAQTSPTIAPGPPVDSSPHSRCLGQ